MPDAELSGILEQKITKFYLNASVLLLGNLASVGILSIEETLRRDGDNLEKVLSLHGKTNPEMVKKSRDFRGEFKITKRITLEYFLENDIAVGDTYESKFILNGHAYIFKCEVRKEEKFKRFGVSAFKIDVTAYDGRKKDEKGMPLVPHLFCMAKKTDPYHWLYFL